MLDGIPFGGAGWVVRNGDAQSQAIAQLPLKLSLPGTALCPIAAAGIGQDEDVAGLRIALVSFYLPPPAKARDGEGGSFVGGSQEHTAAVGLGIVDAIRNADTVGGGAEVMIVDIGGRLLPFHSRVLEVTDQFPLFSIHAQHRIAALFELIPLPTEIAELAVAVGSRTGGNPFAVGTQRILHLPEQPSYGVAADCNPQPLELSSDLVGGLPGPLQPTDGVSSGFPFHQFVDGVDHRGRFFSTGLRPPPTPRTRPTSTSWANSCRRPLATVCGSTWRSSAIWRSPPNCSDSRPAYKRRCRSSSTLANRTIAARSSWEGASADAGAADSHSTCRARNCCCRVRGLLAQYKYKPETVWRAILSCSTNRSRGSLTGTWSRSSNSEAK